MYHRLLQEDYDYIIIHWVKLRLLLYFLEYVF